MTPSLSPGGGPGLAAAGLPRLVSIPSEGRFVRVRPPTVREAVTLLEALPGAIDGDTRDEELVLEVLERWLPEEVRDVLPQAPKHLGPLLTQLINEGAGSALRSAKKKEKSRPKPGRPAAPPNVEALLGDYCSVYGGEAWHVYNTVPWPFFIRLLNKVEMAAARELVRWAQIEMLPHAGKGSKKIAAELSRQARGEQREDPEEFDPATYTPSDEIREEREALRQIFDRKGKGVADA